MSGFDQMMARAARPERTALPDLVEYWQAEVSRALDESRSTKPAAKALEAALTRATQVNLGIMQAMGWHPDAILAAMFDRKEDSREGWTRSLAQQAGEKSAVQMLKWWQAAEDRLMEESGSALEAARKTQDARVRKAVEAFVGESFAACVIAWSATGKTWPEELHVP